MAELHVSKRAALPAGVAYHSNTSSGCANALCPGSGKARMLAAAGRWSQARHRVRLRRRAANPRMPHRERLPRHAPAADSRRSSRSNTWKSAGCGGPESTLRKANMLMKTGAVQPNALNRPLTKRSFAFTLLTTSKSLNAWPHGI